MVAVSDIDTETRTNLADQYALTAAYEDYRELVASEDIDAVMIAAPTQCHAEVGFAALNALAESAGGKSNLGMVFHPTRSGCWTGFRCI